MKNVIFLESVSDFYGSSKIGEGIVKLLREKGLAVEVKIAIERRPEGMRYGDSLNFPILVMSFFRSNPSRHILNIARSSANFFRFLRLEGRHVDTVYCNTFGTLPAAIVAAFSKKKVIIHLHETCPHFVVGATLRLVIKFLKINVFAVSGSVLNSWGLQKNSLATVIHNGISDCKEEAIRTCDIIYVGRLSEKKGFNVFINALFLLSRRVERVNVRVVGGMPPGQSLPDLNLSGCANISLDYLGEIPNGSALFATSNIACIPSVFSDPFPTTVLEAMRAGCQIVASNVGGIPEAVADTECILVEPNNAVELSNALLDALSDNETRAHGERNRLIFSEKFTEDAFRKRLINALDEIHSV